MNLSDNLKKLRKDNNLSQEQLAEKLGVSRQSVSKWESNQAYPEMDKMLQICDIFNLNIDELLNQDIKEVNNTKKVKNNINKYIDDFLDYVTRTVNMFSSMKLKEKIKCIFEQVFIIFIYIIIMLIIGLIGSSIVSILLTNLPSNLYSILYNLLASIYLALSLILGIVLILHIFKIRYLDYYIIVKENKREKIYVDDEKINKQILIDDRKEKVVIRDPKHSGYKFISGLLKIFLFIVKIFTIGIGVLFCLSLVTFVSLFIMSFLFINTGLLFVGSVLILVGIITINIIILLVLFNFISSRTIKKKYLFLTFIISLLSIGVGSGLMFIGTTQFNIIDDIESKYYIEKTEEVEMYDKLFFEDYGNIEYIESNNTNIKLVYRYSKFYDVSLEKIEEGRYIQHYLSSSNTMEVFRAYIDNINNKKIVDYSIYKVYIYTTKENIEKLKQNYSNYLHNLNELEVQKNYDEYENTIRELNEELLTKDEKIFELQNMIDEKNNRIFELEEGQGKLD